MPEKAEKRYAVLVHSPGALGSYARDWVVRGIDLSLGDAQEMAGGYYQTAVWNAGSPDSIPLSTHVVRLVSMVPLEWGVTVRPKAEKAGPNADLLGLSPLTPEELTWVRANKPGLLPLLTRIYEEVAAIDGEPAGSVEAEIPPRPVTK